MPLRKRPIGTLLDLVFGQARVPSGGPRWVTIPPWPYSCHVCDSGGGTIAMATLKRTRSGERLIVCAPCEWRHDLEDVGLSMDEQQRVEAAVRLQLDGRSAAATWNIPKQKLQLVRGRQIDWRKA